MNTRITADLSGDYRGNFGLGHERGVRGLNLGEPVQEDLWAADRYVIDRGFEQIPEQA